MSYLRRKIDDTLSAWAEDPQRLPLIVKGPRQVGKTESIRQFAQGRYESVIEINFVEEPQYKTITEAGYSAESIVRSISILDPSKRFVEGGTLLFFDELQEHPDIATSLKFFAQDGRFDVICSGSVLGVNYQRIESNSVGYKRDVEMLPLDFEEFLWAQGYGSDVSDELLAYMLEGRPIEHLLHRVMTERFMDYAVLGGMPAVVRQFVKLRSFEGSLALQRQIMADYDEDVRKYASGLDQARILSVLRHVPAQLAQENKKFQVTKALGDTSFADALACVEWLEDAGIVAPCRCLSFPELPLRGNYDERRVKLYLADTGLLVSMLDDEAQMDLRANKNLGVYKGALYENLAADALRKQGMGLYYYRREDSKLEEDFFARTASRLVPVEVKARGGRSKALRTLIDSDRYPEISWGVKFGAGNVGQGDNIYTFPLYCLHLLKRWLAEQK